MNKVDFGADMFTGIFRVGEARHPGARITYQAETLAATREEALPLLERHYQEIAQNKDVQRLDPDWDAYETLESAGKLWVMTVRDHGIMVGYIVMLLGRALHYRQLLVASEDIHYLLPEYRRGMTGYKLIAKAKHAMFEKGARLVVMRCKAGQPHGALFERLDGKLQDLVYVFTQ